MENYHSIKQLEIKQNEAILNVFIIGSYIDNVL